MEDRGKGIGDQLGGLSITEEGADDLLALLDHDEPSVGTLLLERVMGYLTAAAPDKAFIGLFAAAGKHPYYERFGFAVQPLLTGMFRHAPVPEFPSRSATVAPM